MAVTVKSTTLVIYTYVLMMHVGSNATYFYLKMYIFTVDWGN
ncbi:MAG: hypothetical protein ABI700_03300 [Chloroflexota bacterium]